MEAPIVGGFVFVFCFAAAAPPGRNAGASADSVPARVPLILWSHLILKEPGSNFQLGVLILKFSQLSQPDRALCCSGENKIQKLKIWIEIKKEREWKLGKEGRKLILWCP